MLRIRLKSAVREFRSAFIYDCDIEYCRDGLREQLEVVLDEIVPVIEPLKTSITTTG